MTPAPIETTTTRTPRLNKNHGFLQCIIRNQIERDEYDKALNLAKQERDARYHKEKAARNIYIPPHLRNKLTPVNTGPLEVSTSINGSTSSPPSVSPQSGRTSPSSSSGNGSDDMSDPHYRLRERARKTLIREGLIDSPPPEQNVSDASEMLSQLNIQSKNLNLPRRRFISPLPKKLPRQRFTTPTIKT